MTGDKRIEAEDRDFRTGFRLVDHTADMGIHARGKTLEESFSHAGRGLFAVISTDLGTIRKTREQKLELVGETLEEMLLAFLDELLFLFEVEHLLFSDFSVKLWKSKAGWGLEAVAEGEKFDAKHHPYPVEVKAVTRHMLEVSEEPPFDIKVLLDL